MLTGQVTQAQAAAEAVDRTVIARLRQVARDGAIAALQASRPGQAKVSAAEASELAKLAAEVDRLGAVVIDQAVELAVVRGNRAGVERPDPSARRRGRQGPVARSDR